MTIPEQIIVAWIDAGFEIAAWHQNTLTLTVHHEDDEFFPAGAVLYRLLDDEGAISNCIHWAERMDTYMLPDFLERAWQVL